MLTDTKIRSLKPKLKVYRVADTNGLCIEMRPAGSKIWRYRYRFAGSTCRSTFGQRAKVLKPFRHWWAHQDSNLEPKDYESSALTIEL